MSALTVSDLRKVEGEPRVHDIRLGELLGFAKPVSVRRIIRRHAGELRRHGAVISTVEKTLSLRGRRGEGRPAEDFYLNEPQALVVCMHSQTPEAVELRAQIIEVFMAWRRGVILKNAVPQEPLPALELVTRNNDNWALADKRARQVTTLTELQDLMGGEQFARALARMPNVLYLDRGDGRRRHQRRPKWWSDLPVRSAIIDLHRQTTLDEAVELLLVKFGEVRAPSRSSLGRFWLQLDLVGAVH